MRRKSILTAAITALTVLGLSGCNSDADVASRNIDRAAEQFEIHRQIIFYNGITDSVFLEVEGFCSYENQEVEIEIVCRDTSEAGIQGFSNHSQGLSDNVTYTIRQTDPISVSTTRPRIIFKPEALIPNVDRP